MHGVSGTPASELLDRPLVRQVAGDGTAGFYRPRLASELLDEPLPPTPGRGTAAYLEGYTWGGLTSGAPIRAVWLVLLPFALLNVAPRLRQKMDDRRVHLLLTLHRWAALGATTGLVFAASGVGIDLFGWQCGGGATCTTLPGWLVSWLAGVPVGVRLAVGALAPAALLGVLWLVSHTTAQRYEYVPDGRPLGAVTTSAADATDAKDTSPGPDEVDPALTSEWLWRGAYMVDRLRHLHLVAGWLCVLVVVNAAVRPVELQIVADVGAGLTLLLVLVALATKSIAGRAKKPGDSAVTLMWVVWILSAAATLVTATALVTGRVATPAPQPSGLPGYGPIITCGVAVQMALVVALAAASCRGRGIAAWRGPAMAALGTLLGAVFSAGVYVYAATWLITGRPVPSVGDVAASLSLSVPFGIQAAAVAFAWAVAVLVAVVLAGGILVLFGNRAARRATSDAAVEADYPSATTPREPERDRQIRLIFWYARLVDRVGTPTVALIILAALASVATTACAVVGLFVPIPLADSDLWRNSYQFGAYAAAGVLVVLVVLGLAVFRAARTRRSVGILWDLASFWPRSVHPLAPPCYAERTVPDLKERIRYYTVEDDTSDYPHGALVLAAHSQGTVIAAAALLQMHASTKITDRIAVNRLAFLSFGCVLHRLYATYFPAYFDAAHADLVNVLAGGRWTNLWRHSDYLGGTVDCTGVDRKLIDPGYAKAPGDLGYPLPGRHSRYPRDPAFQDAVGGLAVRLPPATPGNPDDVPPTVR